MTRPVCLNRPVRLITHAVAPVKGPGFGGMLASARLQAKAARPVASPDDLDRLTHNRAA